MLLRPMIVHRPNALLLAAGAFFTVLTSALFPGDSWGIDNTIFQQFTHHISRQIHKDKKAFAQANTCVSWFYKAEKTPPPTVQGIGWNPTPSSQIEVDCLRHYPSGMDDARDDLAKTQALLRSLTLSYHDGEPAPKQVTALVERFDSWYRSRNMDALMQGMSDLYERGYRVTPSDRVELDRVMG